MNEVETRVEPPAPDEDDDGDSRATRLSVHIIGADNTSREASVQLFDDAAEDPERIAEALLGASLALAHLCGPETSWAVMQRFSQYQGGAPS